MNEQQTEATNQEMTASTSEAASGGVLGTLGIHSGQIISQAINFSLVLLVVWFLILKPLTKKLEERRKIIDDSLDHAKEIEAKMVMANDTYNQKMQEAKAAADAVIARAHDEAKTLTEQMKLDTKQEIASLVAAAKEKIQAEKESTIQEIKARTSELAIAVAEKILSEKLDSARDEKYIADALKDLK